MGFRFDYARLPYMARGAEFDQNRLNWRCDILLSRNKDLINNKVVLDLACHNGRMSYPCLALGASKVIGVEYRQSSIDEGIEYLAATEFKEKMEFVRSDVLEYLSSARPGSFDTIMCFGFLYHTVTQVDVFRQIARLAPEYIIVDTKVAKNYLWYGFNSLRFYGGHVPCLRLALGDKPTGWTDSIDEDGITLWPTASFLEAMFTAIQYDHRKINYHTSGVTSWQEMQDYKKHTRVSYVAQRKS